MKNISNWSIAAIVIGAVFAIGSFWRYYVMYPDIDRMVAYTTLGVVIVFLGWTYNKIVQQGNTLEALEEFIADKTSGNLK